MRAYIMQRPDATLAITYAVRPMRPYAPAQFAEDADGNPVEVAPAVPAETQAEYDAAIIAGALASLPAGTAHVATLDSAAGLPDMPAVQEWVQGADGVPVKRAGNPRIGRDSWAWNGAAVVCPPAAVTAHQLGTLRAVRDRLLADSDGDMLRASEQGAGNAAALRAYRQALRDLPASSADPMAVTWPVKP